MDNFTLSVTLVTIIAGTLLPLLVGLATKLNLHSGVKAALLLLFSLAEGLIIAGTQMDGTAVISKEALLAAAMAWVAGVASYHGFWKPTTISPKINEVTANIGVG